jgi:hypothetical protein
VTAPSVQKFNASTSNWDAQNWAYSFGSSGPSTYSANQPTGQEPAPAPGSVTTIDTRNSYSMPQSAAGTQIRIAWPLSTAVTASSDNTTVANWKQGLHVDCASSISSASASQDFDFWP